MSKDQEFTPKIKRTITAVKEIAMKQTIKLHEMMWDNGTGQECQEVEVEVEITKNGILIKPKGYGDHCNDDGHGCPLLVELCNGHPRVVIWSDINQEDPTDIISLEGAAESLRKPD